MMPKKSKTKTIPTSKFSHCPCVGATLDKLIQPAVLAVLADESLHGYELAKRIGEIPNFLDHAPDVSGIYRILKNLESRSMVVSDWDMPPSGRAKRIFSITPDGRKCLKNWQATLENYCEAIDSLLKTTQNALKRRST